ncbi:MAG TPA: hypothetical protein VHE83_14020, partial [Mycobacteriales bacterium]|nr:hypothetical protein [Mycobacteriales bacterium]
MTSQPRPAPADLDALASEVSGLAQRFAEQDERELAEHEEQLAWLLEDAKLAAVVDDWSGYVAAVRDAVPPEDHDDAEVLAAPVLDPGADPDVAGRSGRELLERAAGLPAIER